MVTAEHALFEDLHQPLGCNDDTIETIETIAHKLKNCYRPTRRKETLQYAAEQEAGGEPAEYMLDFFEVEVCCQQIEKRTTHFVGNYVQAPSNVSEAGIATERRLKETNIAATWENRETVTPFHTHERCCSFAHCYQHMQQDYKAAAASLQCMFSAHHRKRQDWVVLAASHSFAGYSRQTEERPLEASTVAGRTAGCMRLRTEGTCALGSCVATELP